MAAICSEAVMQISDSEWNITDQSTDNIPECINYNCRPSASAKIHPNQGNSCGRASSKMVCHLWPPRQLPL